MSIQKEGKVFVARMEGRKIAEGFSLMDCLAYALYELELIGLIK